MLIRSTLAVALIVAGSSAIAGPIAGGKVYGCYNGPVKTACAGTRVLVGPNGGVHVSTINKVQTPNYKKVTKVHTRPNGGTVRITKVKTR